MDSTSNRASRHTRSQGAASSGYRALYFDLDGTLLDPHSKLEPDTLHVLDRLKERGIRVGIATGRMYHSAEPYIRQVGCNAPLILFNGARINRPDRDEAYIQHRLDRKVARLVLQAAKEHRIHVNLYHAHRYFMDSDDPHGRAFISKEHFMPIMVEDLCDLLDADPVKLLLIAHPEKLAGIRPEFDALVGNRASLVYSEPEFLEVLPAGVNKGRALREAAALMDMTAADIVAFGDGPNDADMLEAAGLGVAMGNARGAALDAADMHTESNADRGVVLALERIFPWLTDAAEASPLQEGSRRERSEEEPT